jgi:hypothetical protein
MSVKTEWEIVLEDRDRIKALEIKVAYLELIVKQLQNLQQTSVFGPNPIRY